MRLLNLRINFYLLRTFCPHLGSFLCCFFFHYVSAKFQLWPSSGDLPRPRIGMLSLVTVSPVITAFQKKKKLILKLVLCLYILSVDYFYDCNAFFKRVLHRTYIYFFNITTNITIIRSTAVYLHLGH